MAELYDAADEAREMPLASIVSLVAHRRSTGTGWKAIAQELDDADVDPARICVKETGRVRTRVGPDHLLFWAHKQGIR